MFRKVFVLFIVGTIVFHVHARPADKNSKLLNEGPKRQFGSELSFKQLGGLGVVGKIHNFLKNNHEGLENLFSYVRREGSKSPSKSVGFAFPNINFEDCIEATRETADLEQLLYDSVLEIKPDIDQGIQSFKEIFECPLKPNIFDDLKCVIKRFNSFDKLVSNFLVKLYDLVSTVEDKWGDLMDNAKSCFGVVKGFECLNC